MQNGKAFAFPLEGAPRCCKWHSMGCFRAHIQSRVLSHPVPGLYPLYFNILLLLFSSVVRFLSCCFRYYYVISVVIFCCCYVQFLALFILSCCYLSIYLFIVYCFYFVLYSSLLFIVVIKFNFYCLFLLWRSKSSCCATIVICNKNNSLRFSG